MVGASVEVLSAVVTGCMYASVVVISSSSSGGLGLVSRLVS